MYICPSLAGPLLHCSRAPSKGRRSPYPLAVPPSPSFPAVGSSPLHSPLHAELHLAFCTASSSGYLHCTPKYTVLGKTEASSSAWNSARHAETLRLCHCTASRLGFWPLPSFSHTNSPHSVAPSHSGFCRIISSWPAKPLIFLSHTLSLPLTEVLAHVICWTHWCSLEGGCGAHTHPCRTALPYCNCASFHGATHCSCTPLAMGCLQTPSGMQLLVTPGIQL